MLRSTGVLSLAPRPPSRTPVITLKVSRTIARGHHVPQTRAIVLDAVHLRPFLLDSSAASLARAPARMLFTL